MLCLTVRAPWATLLARGEKQWETRGWWTHHRGTLALHCAGNMTELEREIARGVLFRDALGEEFATLDDHLGRVIAVVDLAEIVRMDSPAGLHLRATLSPRELAFGNFADSRFVWRLANVRRLATPHPVRGHQLLWSLPVAVERDVREQVPVEDDDAL